MHACTHIHTGGGEWLMQRIKRTQSETPHLSSQTGPSFTIIDPDALVMSLGGAVGSVRDFYILLMALLLTELYYHTRCLNFL